MMSNVKRILNKSEKLTHHDLLNVSEQFGVRVESKTRIADVLQINNSGISNELYTYAMKAHFDFLLVNDETELPLLAVEFDGPSHDWDIKQRERDNKKNNLCEKLEFPFLRIRSTWIENNYRGLNLLDYFVGMWFHRDNFNWAQKEGLIPPDEMFDSISITYIPGTSNLFPYDLSADKRKKIQELYENGVIKERSPSRYVGMDSKGNYRCLAYIKVRKDAWLSVETAMRAQFFPIDCCEVLMDIAVCDMAQKLENYKNGKENALSDSKLDELVSVYSNRYEMVRAGCCC